MQTDEPRAAAATTISKTYSTPSGTRRLHSSVLAKLLPRWVEIAECNFACANVADYLRILNHDHELLGTEANRVMDVDVRREKLKASKSKCWSDGMAAPLDIYYYKVCGC